MNDGIVNGFSSKLLAQVAARYLGSADISGLDTERFDRGEEQPPELTNAQAAPVYAILALAQAVRELTDAVSATAAHP